MNEQINILLAKYIAGEATAAECTEAKAWIAQSENNEAVYIEMYDAWHASLALAGDKLVDADAAYYRFESVQTDINSIPASRKLHRMMAAAAAIAVIALAATWLLQKNNQEQPSVAALQEVNVPVNSKKKILLPDSTLIWLNAETSLKWDKDFNKKNRTVYLEGEAYFEVAPAKNGLPFIVKTTQYTIRDIGTSFNVKSHTAAATFETVVIEGIVSIKGNFSKENNKITEVRLLKNDVLKINSIKGRSATDTVTATFAKPVVEIAKIKKPEVYIGWKDGMLVFDDELFPDMMKKLETRYGVHIKFDGAKLVEQRYSGSFNAEMDIENVLKIIGEVTTGMEYERSGDNIVIRLKK